MNITVKYPHRLTPSDLDLETDAARRIAQRTGLDALVEQTDENTLRITLRRPACWWCRSEDTVERDDRLNLLYCTRCGEPALHGNDHYWRKDER